MNTLKKSMRPRVFIQLAVVCMVAVLQVGVIPTAGMIAVDPSSSGLDPLDGYFNNLLHPDWGAVEGMYGMYGMYGMFGGPIPMHPGGPIPGGAAPGSGGPYPLLDPTQTHVCQTPCSEYSGGADANTPIVCQYRYVVLFQYSIRSPMMPI